MNNNKKSKKSNERKMENKDNKENQRETSIIDCCLGCSMFISTHFQFVILSSSRLCSTNITISCDYFVYLLDASCKFSFFTLAVLLRYYFFTSLLSLFTDCNPPLVNL